MINDSLSRTPYESNSIDLSTLEYKKHPQSSAITLLLIHGSESSKETWNPIIPSLKDKYNIIAVDLRGHGDSPIGNADFSMEQMIADIERVVHSKGLGKFVIVAHSMGVRIAIPYALRHPEQVQALILEDLHVLPYVFPPDEKMSRYKSEQACTKAEVEFLKCFKSEHMTEADAEAEAGRYGYSKEKFQSWWKDGRAKVINDKSIHIGVNPFVTYLARNSISASSQPLEAFKKLNSSVTPILLLKAQKSSCVSEEGLRQMKELQPSMQFQEIPGSEHTIHKTAIKPFLDSLTNFIQPE